MPMRVNLSLYPSFTKTEAVDFPRLDGGLNLDELNYKLETNETPDMKNLWWDDGVLQCRDGQVLLHEGVGSAGACFAELFNGYAFYQAGGTLYCVDPTRPLHVIASQIVPGSPSTLVERGTFFRYGDALFFKNRGGFIKISYEPESSEGVPFRAANVADEAYTPVIVINASPATGGGDMYQPENRLSARKTVWYNAEAGVKNYKLPVKVDSVQEVKVDGTVLSSPDDYQLLEDLQTVRFTVAPPVTEPATNNTVVITYAAQNQDALKAVMDCDKAIVTGSGQNLCILLAGCPAQPNAVFWNSNDNISMNPAYWPMSYYNLVGDTNDPVTGFGKQYSTTVVFKAHSIGKVEYSVASIDGRDSISFTYQDINSRIGCDLPYTIQMIQNNLVFCNSYLGVHMIWSSSAAYENNVMCISQKVNGSSLNGLLCDVQKPGVVVSCDDDKRYWLCANGHVYAWDYNVSTYAKPSWFFFTNIRASDFFLDAAHKLHQIDIDGRLIRFDRVFMDFEGPIEKVYRFPTQFFGSYDRLKDIQYVLLSVRSDTDTELRIQYDTDYERRGDLTNIRTLAYRLVPRNLAYRSLAVPKFAYVAKRKPGCRHIRHFTMSLSNDVTGQDLAVVSAQIFYTLQGKER